ncbi:hypothetical protein HHK36_009247 [Tetracentron sinense]|uniref:Plantacyanin n=1 Tax=Tetracentron sinense TaxID=13715 RepID=A0A834ZAJ0_TETSI|nr:hypothetical protein HHK36_009247 [Tetracentron sinense]
MTLLPNHTIMRLLNHQQAQDPDGQESDRMKMYHMMHVRRDGTFVDQASADLYMSQGRGSAGRAIIVAIALLCLLAHSEIARAATYTVGGTGGWTFNTVTWPKGKRFSAGDVLIFKYSPANHNVVAVNRAGYNSCKTPGGAKVYRTGNDQIRLVKGQNFFICNFVGHCESGMKIAINAL